MLEGSDEGKSGSSKSVEHDEMGQVFFRMAVGVNLVHMIFFINFDVSCVQFVLKHQIREGKSLFINLKRLFCRNKLVFNKKFFFYLRLSKFADGLLHQGLKLLFYMLCKGLKKVHIKVKIC
jgi:hypothetical protein